MPWHMQCQSGDSQAWPPSWDGPHREGFVCGEPCVAWAEVLLYQSCCWHWGPPAGMAPPSSPLPSWFHGKISGAQAVQELQPPADGLFLVRQSQRHPGDYVLCVCRGGQVTHYRVLHREGTLSIDSLHHFSNLIDMIEVRAPAGSGRAYGIPRDANQACQQQPQFPAQGHVCPTPACSALHTSAGLGALWKTKILAAFATPDPA